MTKAAANIMTTALDKLRSRPDLECLFSFDIFDRIKTTLQINAGEMLHNVVQKHVEMLQVTMQNEEQYFWRESGRSNLLVFLLLMERKTAEAKLQNEQCLGRFPNNIAALTAQASICSDQMNTAHSKMWMKTIETLVEKPENRASLEKEKLTAAGEVAYAYTFLGPAFYMNAIENYETLFNQYKTCCKEISADDAELNGRAQSWHFHLAQTYRRMISNGRRQILLREKRFCANFDLFGLISEHLTVVIDDGDEFYKGKAMIELVDAYKTCETNWRHENLTFPTSFGDRDKLMLMARDVAPNDPYVMERYGRHCRQQAKNTAGLQTAITVFKDVLKIAPTRHVAWHQMGLAYRQLWLEVGQHKGARLHTNPNRQPKQRRQGHSRQNDIPGTCPKQSKKGDYWDKLRTCNPVAKPSPSHSREHLRDANKCFIEANRLTKDTQCRYLVDLSRSFYSLCSYDKAEEYLVKANGLSSASRDDNDSNYLYEQWALMRQGRLPAAAVCEDNDSIADIMDLYRKSLLAAVRGKFRSRVALYKLRDILKAQMEQGKNSSPSVKLESDVLSQSVTKYSESSEKSSELVKALENDDKVVEITWEMIRLMHQRQHPHDATKAFLYLTALHKAGKIERIDNASHYARPLYDPLEILEIAKRYVEDKGNCDNDLRAFRDVFRWMTAGRKDSSTVAAARGGGGGSDEDDDDDDVYDCEDDDGACYYDKATEGGPLDLLVLAQFGNDPLTEKVVNLLRRHCRLHAGRVFADGFPDDVLPGSLIAASALELLARTNSVLVIESGSFESWQGLNPVILYLETRSDVRVCRVLSSVERELNDVDSPKKSQPSRDAFRRPRVVLDEQCSWTLLAYSLFKTFFERN